MTRHLSSKLRLMPTLIWVFGMENEIDGLELTNEEVAAAFSDFEAKDLTALIRLKKALWHLNEYGTLAQPEGDDKLRLMSI